MVVKVNGITLIYLLPSVKISKVIVNLRSLSKAKLEAVYTVWGYFCNSELVGELQKYPHTV